MNSMENVYKPGSWILQWISIFMNLMKLNSRDEEYASMSCRMLEPHKNGVLKTMNFLKNMKFSSGSDLKSRLCSFQRDSILKPGWKLVFCPTKSKDCLVWNFIILYYNFHILLLKGVFINNCIYVDTGEEKWHMLSDFEIFFQ